MEYDRKEYVEEIRDIGGGRTGRVALALLAGGADGKSKANADGRCVRRERSETEKSQEEQSQSQSNGSDSSDGSDLVHRTTHLSTTTSDKKDTPATAKDGNY